MKLTFFQLTRTFFLFTVLALALFGIGSLLNIRANPNRIILYVFYALTMFGDAAVLAFCLWQLNKRTKFAFYLSVLVLALNIFLTIFDQFGWADFLFVLLNLIALVALVLARKEILPA